VCQAGRVEASQVKGLGFDATCSLVVADKQGKPLSICPTGTWLPIKSIIKHTY